MTWRKYGILIASSRFPDEPKLQPLRCPEHDVEGLNDILKSSEYGQFSDILVLKNKPHHEVLKDINRVLRRAGRDDLVLIYYSGHGKLNAAGRLHLATLDTVVEELDTSSIPVARIKDLVDISSSNKIVLILDCCFSGAVGDAFARSGVDDQLQLVSGGRGTYILTASTGIQVALEKESDEFGVFTKHMIEGISSGKADMDCDGLVSMDDLYRYVHAQVLSEGFQEPMRWNLNVHGPLFIARSGKTSREERACRIRDIIRDLANKSMVPDAIIAKASEVVAIIPAEQTEEQRAYDVLLERLLQQSPDVGDFIQRWYRVPAKSQPPKTRYPVNGPDRSESIKLKIKQILRRRPKGDLVNHQSDSVSCTLN
ncbi:MAG: caspase family protein [Deltaproteobacteria bacterium]